MFNLDKFIGKIIEAHQDTNHSYDKYLPYEFHLRMALTFGKKYIHLIPKGFQDIVLAAVIAHDSVEDARLTYNNVKKLAIECGATEEQATMIAEMVRAVTNNVRGRDRDERMPDYIYDEIRTIFYSTFVKLCDRHANVQYGLITGGSMPAKYKKENAHFKEKLHTPGLYEEVWEALETLFERA
jgi:hypothetical protein